MRVWIDIGINTQGDGRTQTFGAGNLINVCEFRFALDIQTVNALLECVLNFLP